MKHIKLVSKAEDTTDILADLEAILADPIGWLKEQLVLTRKTLRKHYSQKGAEAYNEPSENGIAQQAVVRFCCLGGLQV